MLEVFSTLLGDNTLAGVFTLVFCIVFVVYVLVQVGLIIYRIISKIINVAKNRKSLTKSESEDLFAEDINDLKTILDEIKIKGR